MLTHDQLIRQMRVLGENYDLISYLLKVDKEEIKKIATNIRNLRVIPIVRSNGFLLCRKIVDNVIRLSIKGKKGLGIGDQFKIVEIRNYSGKPEEYNPCLDMWKINFDKKADYIPITSLEFNVSGRVDNDSGKMINLLYVRGFIVDYGKREFFIDLLTYEKDILEELEYFPFIRVVYKVVNEEGLPLYLINLLVPEEYLNLVIKSIDYMCKNTFCEKIISSN